MTSYTPDTPHIRSGWVYGAREVDIRPEDAGSMFDRWLAQHDAEVATRALNSAIELVEDAAAQGLGLHSVARKIQREIEHYER